MDGQVQGAFVGAGLVLAAVAVTALVWRAVRHRRAGLAGSAAAKRTARAEVAGGEIINNPAYSASSAAYANTDPDSDLECAATGLASEQRFSQEDGPAEEVSVLQAQLERAKQERAAYIAARVAEVHERLQRQHDIERERLERHHAEELAALRAQLAGAMQTNCDAQGEPHDSSSDPEQQSALEKRSSGKAGDVALHSGAA